MRGGSNGCGCCVVPPPLPLLSPRPRQQGEAADAAEAAEAVEMFVDSILQGGVVLQTNPYVRVEGGKGEDDEADDKAGDMAGDKENVEEGDVPWASRRRCDEGGDMSSKAL